MVRLSQFFKKPHRIIFFYLELMYLVSAIEALRTGTKIDHKVLSNIIFSPIKRELL